MKKEFKICPYCWKEIKSKAIKCQYCLRFLVEEKKEKECPFCLNNIDIDSEVCPYCDEKLNDVEEINVVEKDDKDVVEENKTEKAVNTNNNRNWWIDILILFAILIGLCLFWFILSKFIIFFS